MLANKLKKVLAWVVLKAHNTFVEDRQILELVLVAYKDVDSIIDSVWKSKESVVLCKCKLDIEKAYDHVDWSFLLLVMPKMGFGEKWLGGSDCAYPHPLCLSR